MNVEAITWVDINKVIFDGEPNNEAITESVIEARNARNYKVGCVLFEDDSLIVLSSGFTDNGTVDVPYRILKSAITQRRVVDILPFEYPSLSVEYKPVGKVDKLEYEVKSELKNRYPIDCIVYIDPVMSSVIQPTWHTVEDVKEFIKDANILYLSFGKAITEDDMVVVQSIDNNMIETIPSQFVKRQFVANSFDDIAGYVERDNQEVLKQINDLMKQLS